MKLSYKDIFEHLKSGGKVAPKGCKDFHGFYSAVGKSIGINDIPCYTLLIKYNNHGSSAIKFTHENLKWLINTIFDGLDSLELKDKNYFVYA